MKEIHEELPYNQSPAAVFELISSGEFQTALLAHLGGKDPVVVEETRRDDGSVRLVTRQQTAVELPGFARKFIPASTTVVQTFDWGPPQPDGSRAGTWSAEARGAPVSIGGPTELRPAEEGGAVHIYLGQVKASVPVVGGRLEGFAIDNLRRDLARTREYTQEHLQA